MEEATKQPLITRYFTEEGQDPYDQLEWSDRDAEIKDYNSGEVIFEQKGMEFPKSWSDQAVKIVAQKYFAGRQGTTARETSVRQMIDRVVNSITGWGMDDGYFADFTERTAFHDDLTFLLVNQYASFNSPVWFNVGVPGTNGKWCYNAAKKKAIQVKDDMVRPQVSACFIVSVEDTMEDILEHYVREGMIFANGSGAGVNVSSLRASVEHLSGGGKASGPLSFDKGWDVSAGTIKSGGKTRRAARMVMLNVEHPDIEDFIWVKAKQEKIARDLISLGYSDKFNVAGGAYDIVGFQNANHSVRVTNEFMQAVQKGGKFWTKLVKDGKPWKEYNAKDLMTQIAQAAWECGDPGVQFDTTINEWNVCANTEPIVASNPCSEYMFLSDSACNLASLNLMKFWNGSVFDYLGFLRAVDILILAQEILIDNGGYPTEKIALRSHQYRPLGLGFANLGALCMANGSPYDSNDARDMARDITSVMTGEAYLMSSRISYKMGPFGPWDKNKTSALQVILKHAKAAERTCGPEISTLWNDVLQQATEHGLRNAQVTVLAPTGTIAFMMDCATTGIEPELGLVKYKSLVGGGTLKMVNQTVPNALKLLKYTPEAITSILNHIQETGSPEGSSFLKPEHLTVFDCSFPSGPSRRSIHHMGHIKMMAAAQPFLSGAISKTVNVPSDATVEDIAAAYQAAWELGLKSIAVYRDGCKGSQPLSLSADKKTEVAVHGSHQRKVVGDRNGIIHEFKMNGYKGFLTVGLYDDGSPAEIFVDISKEGSTVSGLMDTIAILTSFCLQYGVPLQKLVEKFQFMAFEPSGFTGFDKIAFAKSLPDYIFRWLGLKFLEEPKPTLSDKVEPAKKPVALPSSGDAPLCATCGTITVRSGACHTCPSCGASTGCS